jgi:hypothetical protein
MSLSDRGISGHFHVSLALFLPFHSLQHYHASLFNYFSLLGRRAHGSVVVKALRYKPESRGHDTRWGE